MKMMKKAQQTHKSKKTSMVLHTWLGGK